MIKIIKPGKTDFRLTCNKCGCIFEYNVTDIDDGYIKCPTCGKQYYGFEEDYSLPNTTPDIIGTGTFRVSTDPCKDCSFTKTLETTGYYVGDTPCQWCSKSLHRATCFTTSTSGCTCSASDCSSHACECDSASYEPTCHNSVEDYAKCAPTYNYCQYTESGSCDSLNTELYTCTAEGVSYNFAADTLGTYEPNSFNIELLNLEEEKKEN